jgi:hypothetical protein
LADDDPLAVAHDPDDPRPPKGAVAATGDDVDPRNSAVQGDLEHFVL